VARLAGAHAAGRLQAELVRLGRYPLLVIDEVGYIPFEAEAANLFFQLVSSRCERASVIVTSNKPFGRWGEVFGDATVAAAMINRLVDHAEAVSLKGDSYRLKDRDLGRDPPKTQPDSPDGVSFRPAGKGSGLNRRWRPAVAWCAACRCETDRGHQAHRGRWPRVGGGRTRAGLTRLSLAGGTGAPD
jgi:hypothetical protein